MLSDQIYITYWFIILLTHAISSVRLILPDFIKVNTPGSVRATHADRFWARCQMVKDTLALRVGGLVWGWCRYFVKLNFLDNPATGRPWPENGPTHHKRTPPSKQQKLRCSSSRLLLQFLVTSSFLRQISFQALHPWYSIDKETTILYTAATEPIPYDDRRSHTNHQSTWTWFRWPR
jgi:hypothetical protein